MQEDKSIYQQKSKDEILDSKLVRIRYWGVERKFEPDGRLVVSTKTTGHVSLETSDIYASFWPHEEKLFDYTLIQRNSSSGCYARTPEYDRKKYGDQDPDATIDLRSFNAEKINKKFNKILKDREIFYNILGSPPGKGKGHNCCSLVYLLLNAGKSQPIPHRFSSLDPGYAPKFYLVMGLILSVVSVATAYYVRSSITTSEKITGRFVDQINRDAEIIRNSSISELSSDSNDARNSQNSSDINFLYQKGLLLGFGAFFVSNQVYRRASRTTTPEDVLRIAQYFKGLESVIR